MYVFEILLKPKKPLSLMALFAVIGFFLVSCRLDDNRLRGHVNNDKPLLLELGDLSAQIFVTTLDVGSLQFPHIGGAISSCSASPDLPAGLQLVASDDTCEIKGVPTAVSPSTIYTVAGITLEGASDSATVAITVNLANPPILSVKSSNYGRLGQPLSPIKVTNTGGELSSCSIVPELPTGLSITKQSNFCQIEGQSNTYAGGQYLVIAQSTDGTQSSVPVEVQVGDGSEQKGYQARACGFDLDDDGIFGEAEDCRICDGSTTDPDNDGMDEDLWYVDATSGNDITGDGSAAQPLKTITEALSRLDGSGDGAEDIICIAGIFEEELELTQGGVPGFKLRDAFQYPKDPFMLVGWDKDSDGQYPPYDTDDQAVLDGSSGLESAISNSTSSASYLEIAHIRITDYSNTTVKGALFHSRNTTTRTHVFLHDIEAERINAGLPQDDSFAINLKRDTPPNGLTILSQAFENISINDISGRFLAVEGADGVRVVHSSFKWTGPGGDVVPGASAFDDTDNILIANNIFDGDVNTWNPTSFNLFGLGSCVQDMTIRENQIVNGMNLLSTWPEGCNNLRPIHNIYIDRNIIHAAKPANLIWTANHIYTSADSSPDNSVQDFYVTNNLVYGDINYFMSFEHGSATGPHPGKIYVIGNTVVGVTAKVISLNGGTTFLPEGLVIKNNIFDVEPGAWFYLTDKNYILESEGNTFDPDGVFNLIGLGQYNLAGYRGQIDRDRLSKVCEPEFTDPAHNNYDLTDSDSCARDTGVDVSAYTALDLNGDSRSVLSPDAGAYDEFVEPETLPEPGYTPRACGFDMDHDGTIGEAEDCNVCDGVTTDPDGDGTDEDLLYVDATTGNDITGDGSAGNPYQTIQKALDVADGPGDSAEDIICVAGTFHEILTLKVSGVDGYSIRKQFEYPKDPTMIVGWDKDNDGQYPPYDTDDTAILDGENTRSNVFVENTAGLTYFEAAHLTITKYQNGAGLSHIADLQSANPVHHLYFHDIEISQFNDGQAYTNKYFIATNNTQEWHHLAISNNKIFDSMVTLLRKENYLDSARSYLISHNYIQLKGQAGDSIWGVLAPTDLDDVRILYNEIDIASSVWNPTTIFFANIQNCNQNHLIRGNRIMDGGIFVFSGQYENSCTTPKPVDRIVIDRNEFEVSQIFPNSGPVGLTSYGPVINHAYTIKDAMVTNNILRAASGGTLRRCFDIEVGNDEGPHRGQVTIAGNTCYGVNSSSNAVSLLNWNDDQSSPYSNPLQRIQLFNNILNNNTSSSVLSIDYQPSHLKDLGNAYYGTESFDINSTIYNLVGFRDNFSADHTLYCSPSFVNASGGDLTLDNSDTCATGHGADMTLVSAVNGSGYRRLRLGDDIGAKGHSTSPPRLVAPANQTLLLGSALTPLTFTNSGGVVTACQMKPQLPTGLLISPQGGTCVLSGTPTSTSPSIEYELRATSNKGGRNSIHFVLSVQ